ncbi:hypothetical protein HDU93_003449 [Gonapodya sp. JEL0774]|nr:hypothetical protein HDU93_003449 [Gonapodya sp. JEL0774]
MLDDRPQLYVAHALRHSSYLISHYTVSSLLGYGSNGAVIGARTIATGSEPVEPVAIKLIYKSSTRRVDREVSILLTLSHPSIIKVLDVWQDDRAWYVVTERAGTSWLRSEHWGEVFEVPLDEEQGGKIVKFLSHAVYFRNMSISDAVVDRRKHLTIDEIRHIFGQVAGAMAYLHHVGVVHGDLKEENSKSDLVLISSALIAKLIDFGHARTTVATDITSYAFEVYGTHELSPPEMTAAVLGSKISNQYSRRWSGYEADVWALGLILYGMVYGRLPEEHSDIMRKGAWDTVQGIESYPRPGKEVIGWDVPAELQYLVDRMLTVDVKKRWTMDEVVQCDFLNVR